MYFLCIYVATIPVLHDWIVDLAVSSSPHMEQHHESMNKKPAQPSCYIMTIFLIAFTLLLYTSFKIFRAFALFSFLYTSRIIYLSRPLSFPSTFLRVLRKSSGCVTAKHVWEPSSSSSLIMPGRSATCLNLYREVRGRQKSSIAWGEFRGALLCDWRVSIYTLSLLLTQLCFSSLPSSSGEQQHMLVSPWKYVFCSSGGDS